MVAMRGRWRFWVDRGGTFTDVVARRPDGSLATRKLLSEDPSRYRDAALAGIRGFLGLAADQRIPAARVDLVKMGTTVATNALLERRGARVALVVTEGFRDALRIAYQDRPALFALRIERPEMLYERVIEARERVAADGRVLEPLDRERLVADLRAARRLGIDSVAIAFMHAWRHRAHERAAAALASELGFAQVSASHALSPLMKLVARGDTAVVDAYLSPVLRRYVESVRAEMEPGVRLLFMQSHGGLADASRFAGKDSILSGPAGGVVGAVAVARAEGICRVISFDMGGTSTDIAHYDGHFERDVGVEIAGVRVQSPMLRIHTIAAGGGSLLHFDGARYRVGPDSAGADPGPACYRRGGPLTVTDCNLLLGRLAPARFPRLFGPDADRAVDIEPVRRGFSALAARIRAASGDERPIEAVAAGFRRIAVENMANAIKRISTQRGHDARDCVLQCFGGAGGQHACDVADALGMRRVLVHPLAGVLSAYGIGTAELRALRAESVEVPLATDALAALDRRVDALGEAAREALLEQGAWPDAIRLEARAALRAEGSDASIEVDYGDASALRARFLAAHQRRYGFAGSRALVVASLCVEAVAVAEPHGDEDIAVAEPPDAPGGSSARMRVGERWRTVPVRDWSALAAAARLDGPAIVCGDGVTVVVEAGWSARRTERGALLLERATPSASDGAPSVPATAPRRAGSGSAPVDPVLLEVFNNLFMSIAEQMGAVLENTAHSVNIKERRDFSCALFDADANLVANAPHIPVHLGSMGESVRAVRDARGATQRPGDVYALNDPYHGGTHLPDITAITPLFDDSGERLWFYVANRAHHADIGGITPGSMSPDSTHIDEEGALLDNVLLVSQGRFMERDLRARLAAGRWPARNPDQNIADLRAQLAANACGVSALRALVGRYGLAVVRAYMGHVQDNGESHVRAALSGMSDGAFRCPMDNGAEIVVAVTVDRSAGVARLDFTGSSAQRADNFNAPASVSQAAALYVLRSLVADEMPLNAGCLRPLHIALPAASMLDPAHPAAVVAGNVETSQAIVDALYGALGVMAASQGTMNNVSFGNDRHQYYETLCGGSGAGDGFDGADAVHTHMTNSRLTDPEVLERRFPVRLESFGIRRGSGGRGRNRGGDGVVRRLRFLEPMTVSVLAGRRRVAPFGLRGGGPGASGRHWIERADGSRREMASAETVAVGAGEALVVETPGGGGFGVP